MNAEEANDAYPKYYLNPHIVTLQVCVGGAYVGIVWECILIIVVVS